MLFKVKLRGTDAAWDHDRLVRVGRMGLAGGMRWMSADFNCTVGKPEYVNNVLDKTYIAESKTNFFADDNLPVAAGETPGSKGTYASNGLIYDGVATVNQVWFGFGRTYNFSLRFDF